MMIFFFKTNSSSRLVNQLLTEMDGMESRKEVFLIGATNRPGMSFDIWCYKKTICLIISLTNNKRIYH